jgi:hypothetical protein
MPPGSATAPQIVKIPRLLVVDAVVTASAVLFPALLTIPADADFEWWWLAISRTSALLKLLLEESGTGRKMIFPGSQLTTGQFLGVNVDNLAGTVASNGSFPIAVPYVMPASRAYTHQFSDTSAAPNTVEVVYHGFALLAVPQS